MIEQLRFVQGAVAKKDIVPELTHFCIENGRIKSYNGRIALSCPIPLDLNVRPKAVPFIAAIRACETEVALHMTPTGRLGIKAGKFKAFIECDEKPFPEVFPDGTLMECPDDFLHTLRLLEPFVSDDASRPWSRAIHFKGDHALATNNVVLVQHKMKATFPRDCALPHAGVMEALRIGENPISLLMAENHLSLYYEGDRWLRVQLITEPAPDMHAVIEANWASPADFVNVPADLPAALDTLSPFIDKVGAVHFGEGRVHTSPHDGEGASVAVAHTAAGAYSFAHLRDWTRLLETGDLLWEPSKYPRPVPFFAKGIKGLIIGMRL